jgi:5-methylcytosine-specific restriction endonuclease McrA
MPKDTYYFSHDYNCRNDEKIKRLLRKHGMSGYGIFWSIVEDLYNNSNQLMLDYEGIAYDLRSDIDTIKSIINDFDLFIIEDNMFGSKSIENRIQERSEKSSKARTSALSKWGNNTNQAKRSERLTEARKKATHTKDEWDGMRLFFGECVKCGNKEDLVKDHITPIYQGGSDGLDNLQPLCRKCNASKGSDSTDYRSAYCDKNDCEMPATYLRTPAIKERKEIKGKEIKEINISFDSFWDLYDKKTGDKVKLISKWEKLSDNERVEIMKYIPNYKLCQPDKKFRKDPQTFLNNKSWNDELIGLENNKIETKRSSLHGNQDFINYSKRLEELKK